MNRKNIIAALCSSALLIMPFTGVFAESVIFQNSSAQIEVAYTDSSESVASIKSMLASFDDLTGNNEVQQRFTLSNSGSDSVEARLRITIDENMKKLLIANGAEDHLAQLWRQTQDFYKIVIKENSGKIIFNSESSSYISGNYSQDIVLGVLRKNESKNYVMTVSLKDPQAYSFSTDMRDWSLVTIGGGQQGQTESMRTQPPMAPGMVTTTIPIDDYTYINPIVTFPPEEQSNESSNSANTSPGGGGVSGNNNPIRSTAEEPTRTTQLNTATEIPRSSITSRTAETPKATLGTEVRTADKADKQNPATGDNTPLEALAVLGLASAVGSVIVLGRKEKDI